MRLLDGINDDMDEIYTFDACMEMPTCDPNYKEPTLKEYL